MTIPLSFCYLNSRPVESLVQQLSQAFFPPLLSSSDVTAVASHADRLVAATQVQDRQPREEHHYPYYLRVLVGFGGPFCLSYARLKLF